MAVHKCFEDRKQTEKDDSSLREPLLGPEEVLDASGHCRLPCCSDHFQENTAQDVLEVEYPQENTSEEDSDSLPGSIRAITDDSEEDLEEQGVKIIKWEDFTDNVSVTLVGDGRSSLKGKEIVEELEDDTTDSDRPRSETITSRMRRESRSGKNLAKIYPEPLDPPLTSLQAPHSHSLLAGQSSTEYGLNILDQPSWDHHFKADAKLETVTGECSKS